MAFFVWIVDLGKCLTIDNLRKREVWILDWCYICKCNGELVDHLFLHFPAAMDLWSMVLGIWSKLGYAKVSCGAPCLLARPVWSSSKWSYMDNRSPFFNVVSLEGKKQ